MPAVAANAVGVSTTSMRRPLQIAKAISSAKVCSLHDAPISAALQNASMDEGKNGGPNHLQAWREFRRMSQERLGELVGTTGAVISLLEAGERGLSAKWLRRLAPVLGTTPGHLLDHDPNELESDVIEMWTHAPIEQKRQLYEITRTIMKEGRKR
jgi:transcriptional regulator with XRE-family HTH domain